LPSLPRSAVTDSALLLLGGGCLQLLYFCGFGLGDDVAYDALATQIRDTGYPRAEGTLVFAGRPLLLLAIAGSYHLFGQHEMSFVLPVMAAALLSVCAVYTIGRLLGGRAAGLVAAAVLMTSTLHVTHATTMTNDIVGAALLGVAGVLGAAAASRRDGSAATLLAAGAGVAAASSGAVKNSFLLLAVPLLLLLAGRLAARQRLVPAVGVLAGAALGAALIAVFFLATAGDPLAGLRVELAFNRAHLLETASERPLRETLLFYPRILLGTAFVGPPGFEWRPAGLFFPVAFAASAAAALLKNRPAAATGAVMCVMLLILQFWPLQLSPYVPVHRLPRFLYPTLLPGAIVIGLVASRFAAHGRTATMLVAAGFAALAWNNLAHASRAVTVHTDSMVDPRFAASLAMNATGPVVADEELIAYMGVRARADRRDPVLLRLTPTVAPPRSSMVIVGGSRRPELDAAYPMTAAPEIIPPEWVPLLSLPGEPRPWRSVRGTVYVVARKGGQVPREMLHSTCPAAAGWRLRDVIDVGDPEAEHAHEYQADEVTWRGGRVLRESGADTWDDGVAFTGTQEFVGRELTPGRALCVAKRVDPRVARQRSRIESDGAEPSPFRVEAAGNGEWGRAVAMLPAEAVTGPELRLRERFVSSTIDVNAFRIELYQREE
jgi:hypothetical protein